MASPFREHGTAHFFAFTPPVDPIVGHTLPVSRALDGLVLVYGLVLVALGVYGFTADGSVISLIAGGAAGLLTLFFLWFTGKNPRVGRIGNTVVALALAGQFLPKAIKGPKVPGAAIWHVWTIAVLSVVVFLALGLGHMAASRAKRGGVRAV